MVKKSFEVKNHPWGNYMNIYCNFPTMSELLILSNNSIKLAYQHLLYVIITSSWRHWENLNLGPSQTFESANLSKFGLLRVLFDFFYQYNSIKLHQIWSSIWSNCSIDQNLIFEFGHILIRHVFHLWTIFFRVLAFFIMKIPC